VIARYVVLSRLGAGAMGLVLAAYDPDLDRKVAIKLLKPRAGRDQEADRARLQREAQALAKLAHPNVVGVHDVGVRDGQVFVAMEFVEGQTLGEWMRTADGGASRRWRETLDVFVAAGRGLAAAHDRGLIHRDFKPDNVMLGSDGRVRVMDFGLARAGEDEIASEPVTDEEARSPLATPLTRTGALMGTPAYMAPEQFSGTAVTARSDQFGFCVALFEALYGVRPFRGETFAELLLAVTDGELIDPPRGADVPAWLGGVLRRGLAVDPEQRYSDMHALLIALGRGEAQRRRRMVLGGVALLSTVVAGVAGFGHWDETRVRAACIAEGDAVGSIWNDARRESLRRGLLASNVSFAEPAADNAIPYLDAQAVALSQARTQACLDTRVLGNWNTKDFERASWCLDERVMELDSLVEELTHADSEAVRGAVIAAASLESVDACLDTQRLARLPVAPDSGAETRALRRQLSRAGALRAGGKYEAALVLARGALERADEMHWPPLSAAARRMVGSLLDDMGEFELAERSLEQAYFDAAKAGAMTIAAEAAEDLVWTVGYQRAQYEQGLRWARHADTARSSLGQLEDELHRAGALHNIGNVHSLAGNHDLAQSAHEESLAIRERKLGPEHPMVAESLNSLANTLGETGQLDKSLAAYTRALDISRRALGDEHPQVAGLLANLGQLHESMGNVDAAFAASRQALSMRERDLGADHPDVAITLGNIAMHHEARGEYEQARVLYERCLTILEKALGPDHPDVAMYLNNLAGSLYFMGEIDAAVSTLGRAIEIRESALGPDHGDLAASLNNLGMLHEEKGDLGRAIPLYERSLAILARSLGSDHPDVASAMGNLGIALDQAGDHERARDVIERSLEIREAKQGGNHPDLAFGLAGLGDVLVNLGEWERAIGAHERGLDIRTHNDVGDKLLAESRFLLAQVLWNAPSTRGRDRQRAVALATEARDGFTAAGDCCDEQGAEVATWLSKHAGVRNH
jgi:tetratricopeptide (TPR) repeat protein/tRNA A-37 threonylcarbamoyl transferase component Bud32